MHVYIVFGLPKRKCTRHVKVERTGAVIKNMETRAVKLIGDGRRHYRVPRFGMIRLKHTTVV